MRSFYLLCLARLLVLMPVMMGSAVAYIKQMYDEAFERINYLTDDELFNEQSHIYPYADASFRVA